MGVYYTNATVRSGQTTQEYALGLTSNYAVDIDGDKRVVLDNLTTGLTKPKKEVIEFWFNNIATVDTEARIEYPTPIKSGVQYGIKLHEVVTKTMPDGSIQESPVVVQLQIRHQLDDAVTESVLQSCMERLLSCLRRESDNSYRFDDLVRGALRPKVD